MAATTVLREALNEGISSGNFIDTKIILYSHRDSSGRIYGPRALYANSHVLKTVCYFNDRECAVCHLWYQSITRISPLLEVLFGNFAESQSTDFNDTIEEEEYAEDYGYLSDSDLESDDDDVILSEWLTHESGPIVPRSKPPTTPDGAGMNKERIEKGKVVKIQDMAFVTWVKPGSFQTSIDITTGSKPF